MCFRTSIKTAALALIFLTTVSGIFAANGDLDLTFGVGGKVITPVGNSHDVAFAMAIQTDGKIVLAGGINITATDVDFALARYNSNGSLDTSFGNGGKVITRIGNAEDYANAVAIQPDGKIVVAGVSGNYPNADFALIRYNTDGSLDISFGTDGKVIAPIGNENDEANAIALQSDGRIIAAGRTGNYPNPRFALARFNADGSLDNSFGTSGKVITSIGGGGDEAIAVVIQPDGRIVAAGLSSSTIADTDFAVVRYNTDGTLDNSFGNGGKVTTQISGGDTARTLALQSDGKIIAAGYSANELGNLDFALVRYNPNGSLDSSFGTGGKVITRIRNFDEIANDLIILPTGKILAAGWSSDDEGYPDFALALYHTNGTLDTSFGTGGKVVTEVGSLTDFGMSAEIQSDGKIVVAGYISNGMNFDFSVVRYQAISNKTQFDFDGDGKADVSVYRPSNGTWYLLNSASGFVATQFGFSTDKLSPSDFDGDGRTDVSVFRDGTWYRINSSNGQFVAIQFGQAGDVPVPADYDGDGKADVAVFRSGVWYILQSSNNQFSAIQFGIASDIPVPVDFDGDRKTDVAVFRDGNWYWLQSRDNQFRAVQFGQTGDKPVVGDYDGDGKADQAVFRNGIWYLNRSQLGFTGISFGNATDIPAPADFDGDNKTDVAVFRDGVWYRLNSSNNQFVAIQFGITTDNPVPSAFIP